MNIRISVAMTVLALAATNTLQASLPEARELLLQHQYMEALQMAETDIAAAPKSEDVPGLQLVAGESCTALGDYQRARDFFNKAKAKQPSGAAMGMARLDMLQYRFDEARENYAKVKTAEGDAGRRQAMLASDFLGRVQQLAIVDSICVDADKFFQAYELTSAAGKLMAPDAGHGYGKVIYSSEDDALRMYAKVNKEGSLQLMMADRLTDGSTEETPIVFGTSHTEESDDDDDTSATTAVKFDSDYPYLLSDGQTLYFAHNGPGGIGGYDIYIANGSILSGEFMNPSNMGMPFNSPANDYMLAIDEETGFGWWATDRHHPDGKLLTIYIFAPAELRVNLPADDQDIKEYARGLKWHTDPAADERYRNLDAVLQP